MVYTRLFHSILLAASLLGCQSSPIGPIGDEVAAALAPGMRRIEAEAGSRPAREPALRTRLHIPEEYVARLNWEPLAGESGAVENRTNAPELPRATPIAEPRREREFRTTGVRVTVSRSGGAHPVGLPGHAVGLPGHPAELSAHPVSLQGHPVELPAHPVRLQGHPVRLPRSPVKLPGHPVRLPEHPVNLPGQPLILPGHPVLLSGHPIGPPGRRAGGRSSR